ncbi:MAG: glycoside hydrolase family 16 protein [Chitinophagaceae bacterium]
MCENDNNKQMKIYKYTWGNGTKAESLYGRVEVKAKMPKGGGMWPAIWMMRTNRREIGWPLCGEIDIMEFIGNHPTDLYGTIHYPDTTSKQHKSQDGKINDTSLSTTFHVALLEFIKDTYKAWRKTHNASFAFST